MDNLEKLVKESYNACWNSYKQYLNDNDMAAYNERSKEIVGKYGHANFVENNLLLFAPVVNTIHDELAKRRK